MTKVLRSSFMPKSFQCLAHLICIWIPRHHTDGAKHPLSLQRFRDMVFIKLSAYVPGSTAFSTVASFLNCGKLSQLWKAFSTVASFLSIDMGTFIQQFLMTKISLMASCSIFL